MTQANHPAPGEGRSCLVKALSYDRNHGLSGVLLSSRLQKPLRFSGQMQLLLAMEELLDTLRLPQQTTEYRRFPGVPAAVSGSQPAADEETPLAVFQISVYYRQNASWQGTVTWQEKRESVCFRSTWELLRLMDSALSA